MNNTLPVNEVFLSIQGEGPRVGRSSIFVRTSLCNLRCEGFGCEYETPEGEKRKGCDTYYAVDPVFSSDWNNYSVSELTSLIDDLIVEGTKPDIVITGGEPTIHWENPVFQEVLDRYLVAGHNVTIETNASHVFKLQPKHSVNSLNFSMSVKLSCSGEPFDKRINIENINNIIRLSNGWFKFVVESEDDVREVKQILRDCYKCDVFLMPLGENKENLEKTKMFVVDTVIENGWNYSPRLHVDLWNDLPGC